MIIDKKRYREFGTEIKCLVSACIMLAVLNIYFIIQSIVNLTALGGADAKQLCLSYIAPIGINAVSCISLISAAVLFFDDRKSSFKMIRIFFADGLVFTAVTSAFALVGIINGRFSSEEALSHNVFMLCTQVIDFICFLFFFIRFSVSVNTKYHFNLIRHPKSIEEEAAFSPHSNTDTAIFNVSSIKEAIRNNKE